jgi:cytochrome c-type biogenesis protein CcmF
VRPWTLAAWCSLSLGIALGSYWAYYELGWGGWWFWDPVENASFMPWLAATALLHSAIVVEKRDSLKSWTILLAILAFSLSLLGTFLVRSGVLTSVHAFAVDPRRGVFILALLALAIGGSLVLYAWRAPALRSRGLFAPVSREGALLLNNLLLATACATVLLGTLYPLLLEAVGGPKISVGPPYFNATFVPLMVPLLIAIPIGSMLAWKRGDLAGVLGRLKFALLIAALALLVQLGFSRGAQLLAAGAMAIAVWLLVGTLWELIERVQLLRLPPARSWQRARRLPRASYAMTLAHFGVGVLVAGVTASTAWQSEAILVLQPGQSARLAGYSFTLARLDDRQGPNYVLRRAVVDVTRDGSPVATLTPEKRYYPVEGQPTSEAGIDMGFWRDLYVVLGDPAEGAPGGHTMRIYVNPLVMWIWGGVAIMGVAGLISLSDRRHRVGAPSPARTRLAPAGARA